MEESKNLLNISRAFLFPADTRLLSIQFSFMKSYSLFKRITETMPKVS